MVLLTLSKVSLLPLRPVRFLHLPDNRKLNAEKDNNDNNKNKEEVKMGMEMEMEKKSGLDLASARGSLCGLVGWTPSER